MPKVLAPTDALFIGRITLRGHEMEVLQAQLQESRGARREEIYNRFSPHLDGEQARADTVRSALDALWTLGLIEAEEDNGSQLFRAVRQPPGRPFRLALLGALTRSGESQRAFAELYGWCVLDGRRRLTAADLLNQALANVPREESWNADKIGFWITIAAFVGIMLPAGDGVLIAPRADMLLEILRAVLPTGQDWASAAFERVAENWAHCFTRRGALHPGWAQALDTLARRGEVELDAGSDPPTWLDAELSNGTRWARIALGSGS